MSLALILDGNARLYSSEMSYSAGMINIYIFLYILQDETFVMDLENGLENTQKNEQRLLYDFLSSSTIFGFAQPW